MQTQSNKRYETYISGFILKKCPFKIHWVDLCVLARVNNQLYSETRHVACRIEENQLYNKLWWHLQPRNYQFSNTLQ